MRKVDSLNISLIYYILGEKREKKLARSLRVVLTAPSVFPETEHNFHIPIKLKSKQLKVTFRSASSKRENALIPLQPPPSLPMVFP